MIMIPVILWYSLGIYSLDQANICFNFINVNTQSNHIIVFIFNVILILPFNLLLLKYYEMFLLWKHYFETSLQLHIRLKVKKNVLVPHPLTAQPFGSERPLPSSSSHSHHTLCAHSFVCSRYFGLPLRNRLPCISLYKDQKSVDISDFRY